MPQTKTPEEQRIDDEVARIMAGPHRELPPSVQVSTEPVTPSPPPAAPMTEPPAPADDPENVTWNLIHHAQKFWEEFNYQDPDLPEIPDFVPIFQVPSWQEIVDANPDFTDKDFALAGQNYIKARYASIPADLRETPAVKAHMAEWTKLFVDQKLTPLVPSFSDSVAKAGEDAWALITQGQEAVPKVAADMSQDPTLRNVVADYHRLRGNINAVATDLYSRALEKERRLGSLDPEEHAKQIENTIRAQAARSPGDDPVVGYNLDDILEYQKDENGRFITSDTAIPFWQRKYNTQDPHEALVKAAADWKAGSPERLRKYQKALKNEVQQWLVRKKVTDALHVQMQGAARLQNLSGPGEFFSRYKGDLGGLFNYAMETAADSASSMIISSAAGMGGGLVGGFAGMEAGIGLSTYATEYTARFSGEMMGAIVERHQGEGEITQEEVTAALSDSDLILRAREMAHKGALATMAGEMAGAAGGYYLGGKLLGGNLAGRSVGNQVARIGASVAAENSIGALVGGAEEFAAYLYQGKDPWTKEAMTDWFNEMFGELGGSVSGTFTAGIDVLKASGEIEKARNALPENVILRALDKQYEGIGPIENVLKDEKARAEMAKEIRAKIDENPHAKPEELVQFGLDSLDSRLAKPKPIAEPQEVQTVRTQLLADLDSYAQTLSDEAPAPDPANPDAPTQLSPRQSALQNATPFLEHLARYKHIFRGGVEMAPTGAMPGYNPDTEKLTIDPAAMPTLAPDRIGATVREEAKHVAVTDTAKRLWGDQWRTKMEELYRQAPEPVRQALDRAYGASVIRKAALEAEQKGETQEPAAPKLSDYHGFNEMIRMILQADKDFDGIITESTGISPMTTEDGKRVKAWSANLYTFLRNLTKTVQSWLTAGKWDPQVKTEMEDFVKQVKDSALYKELVKLYRGDFSAPATPTETAPADTTTSPQAPTRAGPEASTKVDEDPRWNDPMFQIPFEGTVGGKQISNMREAVEERQRLEQFAADESNPRAEREQALRRAVALDSAIGQAQLEANKWRKIAPATGTQPASAPASQPAGDPSLAYEIFQEAKKAIAVLPPEKQGAAEQSAQSVASVIARAWDQLFPAGQSIVGPVRPANGRGKGWRFGTVRTSKEAADALGADTIGFELDKSRPDNWVLVIDLERLTRNEKGQDIAYLTKQIRGVAVFAHYMHGHLKDPGRAAIMLRGSELKDKPGPMRKKLTAKLEDLPYLLKELNRAMPSAADWKTLAANLDSSISKKTKDDAQRSVREWLTKYHQDKGNLYASPPGPGPFDSRVEAALESEHLASQNALSPRAELGTQSLRPTLTFAGLLAKIEREIAQSISDGNPEPGGNRGLHGRDQESLNALAQAGIQRLIERGEVPVFSGDYNAIKAAADKIEGEHIILFDEHAGKIVKIPMAGRGLGQYREDHSKDAFSLYLERFRLTNLVFGEDFHFQGFVRHANPEIGWTPVISQRLLPDFRESTPQRKAEFLRGHGFESIGQIFWVHPETGLYLADATTDNVPAYGPAIEDKVAVTDVQIYQVDPDVAKGWETPIGASLIHRALSIQPDWRYLQSVFNPQDRSNLYAAPTPDQIEGLVPQSPEQRAGELRTLNALMTTPGPRHREDGEPDTHPHITPATVRQTIARLRRYPFDFLRDLARDFVARTAPISTKREALSAIKLKLEGGQAQNKAILDEQFQILGEAFATGTKNEEPRTRNWLRNLSKPSAREDFAAIWNALDFEHRRFAEALLGFRGDREVSAEEAHAAFQLLHDRLISGLNVPLRLRAIAYASRYQLDADGYPISPYVLPNDDPRLVPDHQRENWPQVKQIGKQILLQPHPVAKPGEQPRVTIIAGGPHSGQRTFAIFMANGGALPTPSGLGMLESIGILPSFDAIRSTGDGRAVQTAEVAAREMLDEAIVQGRNERRHLTLFMDLADPESAITQIQAFKEAGYLVDLIGMSQDYETVAAKTIADYRSGIWLALPEVIASTLENHRGMANEEITDLADTFQIVEWDSSRQLTRQGANLVGRNDNDLRLLQTFERRAANRPRGSLFGPLEQRSAIPEGSRGGNETTQGRGEATGVSGVPDAGSQPGALSRPAGSRGPGAGQRRGHRHRFRERADFVAAEDALEAGAVQAIREGQPREDVLFRWAAALNMLQRRAIRAAQRVNPRAPRTPSLRRLHILYANRTAETQRMAEAAARVCEEVMTNPEAFLARLDVLDELRRTAAGRALLEPEAYSTERDFVLEAGQRLQQTTAREPVSTLELRIVHDLVMEMERLSQPQHQINWEALREGYGIAARMLHRAGIDPGPGVVIDGEPEPEGIGGPVQPGPEQIIDVILEDGPIPPSPRRLLSLHEDEDSYDLMPTSGAARNSKKAAENASETADLTERPYLANPGKPFTMAYQMWQAPAGQQMLDDFDAYVRPRLNALTRGMFSQDEVTLGKGLALLDELAAAVGVRGAGLTRETTFRNLLGFQAQAAIARIRNAIKEKALGGTYLSMRDRVPPTTRWSVISLKDPEFRALLKTMPDPRRAVLTSNQSLESRLPSLIQRLETKARSLTDAAALTENSQRLVEARRILSDLQFLRTSVMLQMAGLGRQPPADHSAWHVGPAIQFEIDAYSQLVAAHGVDPVRHALAEMRESQQILEAHERAFTELATAANRDELHAAVVDLDQLPARATPEERLEKLTPVAHLLSEILPMDRREMLRIAGRLATNWTPDADIPLRRALGNEILFRAGDELYAAPAPGLTPDEEPGMVDVDHAILPEAVQRSIRAIERRSGHKLQAVAPTATRDHGAALGIAESLRKNLGVATIFVRAKRRGEKLGFLGYSIVGDDFVLVNIDTPVEWIPAVVGHEFAHRWAERDPAAYQTVHDLVLNQLSPEDHLAHMEHLESTGLYSQEELDGEIVADVIGDIVANRLGLTGDRVIDLLPREVADQLRTLVPGQSDDLHAAPTPDQDPEVEVLQQLAALMAEVSAALEEDPADAAYDAQLTQALNEPAGQRTLGNPRYANPASNPQARVAYDVSAEAHREGIVPETLAAWTEEGNAWVAGLGDIWTAARHIVSMTMSGQMLNDFQTRGAMGLADRLWTDAIGSGDRAKIREARTFSWAYSASRTANARALAAGRDPNKTPAQRNIEFVARYMTRLSPEALERVEKGIPQTLSKEEQAAKRQELAEQELDKQWARMEEELNLAGLSLADIFEGTAITRLRNSRTVQRVIDSVGKTAEERQAVRMMIDGHKDFEITVATRLGDKRLGQLEEAFDNAILPVFEEWASLGITLANLPDEEALSAAPNSAPAPGGTPSANRAKAQAILKNLKSARKVRNTGRVKRTKTGPGANPAKSQRFDINKVEAVVQLARMMQTMNGHWGDVLFEYTTAGLLSGIKTQKRNIAGTALYGMMEYSVRWWVRWAVNKLAHDPNSAQSIREWGYILEGIIPGLIDGIQKGALAFKNEYAVWDTEKLNEPVLLENLNEKGGGKVAISETPFLQLFGSEGFDWLMKKFGQEGGIWTKYNNARMQAVQAARKAGMDETQAVAAGEAAGRAAVDQSLMYAAQEWADKLLIGYLFKGSNIRIPLRVMMFFDQVLSGMFGRMEVAAQAYRRAVADAKKLGLKGEDRGKHITKFMQDEITNYGSISWIRGVDKAQDLSMRKPLRSMKEGGNFLEELTKNLSSTLSRRQNHPAMQALQFLARTKLRFLTTIFRAFSQMLALTPLSTVWHGAITAPKGVIRGLYRIKNGEAFMTPEEHTKLVNILGDQVIIAAYTLFILRFSEGDDDDDDKPFLITGTHAYGSEKKGEIELSQRKYGSGLKLRIGTQKDGTWISLTHKDPISGSLGLTVDMVRAYKRKETADLNTKEWLNLSLRMVRAQTGDKSFTKSIADLAEMAEAYTSEDGDVAGVTKRYLEDTAGQFVPNLLKSPLREIEDEVTSTWEQPGYYGYVPVGGVGKVDLYGNPVKRELSDSPLSVLRLLFDVGIAPSTNPEEEFDTFLEAYIRQGREWPAGISIPASQREYTYRTPLEKGPVNMTAKEARKYQERVGLRFTLKSREALSAWDLKHPTEEKLIEIHNLLNKVRKEVKEEMFPSQKLWERKSSAEKARLPEE